MFGLAIAMVCVMTSGGEPAEWVVEGVCIARPKLTVQRETKTTPPKTKGQPARMDDKLDVMTDFGRFEIQYSRYLNRAPQFSGRHPASPTSDWGIGICGYGSQWYRGNTVRVLLDGQDIVHRYAADAIDVREGHGTARVRFRWKLPEADVAIHVAVLNGRSEGLVEVAVKAHRPLKSVGVNLLCYPGGFGPAYGFPSRRWVRMRGADVSVGTGEKSRTLDLAPTCEWVWYGDREGEDRGLYNTSSVGLVLLPDEKARGKVKVSSYGVGTELAYVGTQSRVRVGLCAYPGPNPRAWRVFHERRKDVAQLLRKIDFWPGDTP